MTPVTAVIVYILIWWLTLFVVLPWGVRLPDDRPKGHAHGAPDKPRMWRKVLITTIVSSVLFVIVFAVIEFDVVTFRPGAGDTG